jgi:hypothetical protein
MRPVTLSSAAKTAISFLMISARAGFRQSQKAIETAAKIKGAAPGKVGA